MLKQLDENNRYYYIVELASKNDFWIPLNPQLPLVSFKKYDIINGMLTYATQDEIDRYRQEKEKQREY